MNRSALKRRQLLELLGIGAGSSAAAMLLPQLEARSRGGRAARDVKVDYVPLAPLCKHSRVHQAKCVVTHLII